MRRVGVFVVSLACLLCGQLAHAVTWNAATDFAWHVGTGNITSFPSPGSGNVWATGLRTVDSAGVHWTGPQKALPFNPSPTFNFKAGFSPSNIGKGLVTGAAVAIPLLVSPTISLLLNQACVRAFGGAMTLAPGGQWEECHFTTQTTPQWQGHNHIGTVIGPWRNSYPEADADIVAWYNANSATTCFPAQGGQYKYSFSMGSSDGNTWHVTATCGPSVNTGYATGSYGHQNATSQVQDGWQSSTAANAETKVNTQLQNMANSSDPNLGKVMDEMFSQGQSVQGTLEAPTVQTPIMDPDLNVVKSDPASGTTTTDTTKTKNDFTCTVIYQGEAISCAQYQTKTTTSVTTKPDASNPGTNTTTTVTTVLTQTKDSGAQDNTAFSDTPMPSVPVLYQRKYPDGLSGVWNTRKAELSSTPLLSLARSVMPNIGDGGTCPTFDVGLDVGIADFGTQQVRMPCWLWPVLKIITICSALLLARALVFGG